jgi:hypothetical protein
MCFATLYSKNVQWAMNEQAAFFKYIVSTLQMLILCKYENVVSVVIMECDFKDLEILSFSKQAQSIYTSYNSTILLLFSAK